MEDETDDECQCGCVCAGCECEDKFCRTCGQLRQAYGNADRDQDRAVNAARVSFG